ncbi:hypothetical protein [Campylobacter concisus]|uniref:hypothetical protein n=1 Tax=Campylobacter concisus TaxID=199 RepID=UPI00112FC725|nr:hypothetical protein [Campylobacter concisus]
MNEFFSAFWREFQYKIVDLIVYMTNQYPIVAWTILYFLGLPVLYFSFKFICHSFIIYSRNKSIKILKTNILLLISIVIVFYFLVKFTIYKSYGYLIYLCIFTWISAVGVIIWALWPEKFAPNKPQDKKRKKQKKIKIKFEKKNSLNFTNVKLKNKQCSSGDDTVT